MDLKAAWRHLAAALCGTLACVVAPAQTQAQAPFIVVATTTSTEQSGLFGHLLPRFKRASGIDVRVVAVGTGQALDAARRGDADAVLVHDAAAEELFVAQGFAAQRRPVMVNDFVLVGPTGDPARSRGSDIAAALRRIAASGAGFVSRGDRSGTHAAELRQWRAAGIDLERSRPAAYRACGCGMGAALNMAAATGAYALTDRGTWLAFKNRADLGVLVEGDPALFNPYGVMVVSAAKHPHVKQALAQAFADWLVGAEGQAAIAAYQIGGQPLFLPNAGR